MSTMHEQAWSGVPGDGRARRSGAPALRGAGPPRAAAVTVPSDSPRTACKPGSPRRQPGPGPSCGSVEPPLDGRVRFPLPVEPLTRGGDQGGGDEVGHQATDVIALDPVGSSDRRAVHPSHVAAASRRRGRSPIMVTSSVSGRSPRMDGACGLPDVASGCGHVGQRPAKRWQRDDGTSTNSPSHCNGHARSVRRSRGG